MVLPSDRPRVRGTYKKSEASRNQVIQAGVALLAERGLARTSVGDIARAAGLSKGAVHYHFDSKHDLLEQVLEHCAAQLRERMVEAWQSAADPAERVRSVVRAQRDVRRETSAEFRVLAELRVAALHDEGLRRAFVRVAEQDRREFVAKLAASLDSIGLEPALPLELLHRLLAGALDGLALLDQLDPADAAESEAMAQLLSRVGEGFFAPRG